MKSRVLGFASLALACILAAGGGAYLAVRQSNQAGRPAQTADQVPAASMPVSTPQGTPASMVTTPAAPADNAPLATAAPAEPSTASTRSREADRPSRRAAQPGSRSRAAETDQVASASADPASGRPGAAPTPAPDQAPPVPPAAQPQSVTQPPPEPQREWVEVSVPSESVLGLQIQTPVSSETARVEDRVEARVTRDIRVDDRVAIPAGAQAIGSVVQVDRGGKVKERAHFAIRFNSLVLPDGTRLPINAEAVHREGPSPANKSAARIGGATIGGAILGAILGGGKGAAIGGAIGAGGGTAATMASDREPATLAAGSIVNIRLMSPVSVTLER